MWKVIVVGGGASGLLAADTLNGLGVPALVLEGNSKPAKKLLATGNGRCNLSSRAVGPEHYHGDKLAARVLEQLSPEQVRDALREKGLLLWEDREGRFYPYGNQAAAVTELLLRGAGAREEGSPVVSIEKSGGVFRLRTAAGAQYEAERVILACGGRSYPSLSLGASGYELAKALGHRVTELTPSLAPLKTSKPVKALKGARARAELCLWKDGKAVYQENGEVIFGEGHLSGICIFNASAHLRETGLRGVEVSLDLFRDLSAEALTDYLKGIRRAGPDWEAADLFGGALSRPVGRALTKELGFLTGRSAGTLSDGELERAARLAKDWRFPVTGTGFWEEAQVTAGGVPLGEIDPATMESLRCPGLYLTGELLDADGDCGGYNLHWAWLTGLLAGRAAAKEATGLC